MLYEVITYMMRLWNNETRNEEPTWLFGRNLEVEQTNRARLNQLESEETIMFAEMEMFGNVHEKRLSSWKEMLPVSHMLTLRNNFV